MKKLLLVGISAILLSFFLFLPQANAQCPSSSAAPASDLGITFSSITTSDGRVVITFKVVNTNQSGNFEYLACQLPVGAVALTTDTTYQYSGTDANAQKLKYSVANPSSDPSSTIKFTLAAAKGKFKSDTYDIFTYTMSSYEFSKMDNLIVEANHGKNTTPVKVTFPIKSKPLTCLPTDPNFTASGIKGINNPMSGTIETYSVESADLLSYKWVVPDTWSIISGQNSNSITVKVGSRAGGVVVDMEKPGNSESLMRTMAVSPTPGPLPVELVSFNGMAKNGAVELNWITATEIDNDQFEIERSANGKDFVKIASVKGAGNSNTLQNYRFLDTSPLAGTSYYRLKQVDFNQTHEYSKVIAVKTNATTAQFEASLHPNPITENYLVLRLKSSSQTQNPVSFKMTDLNGKTVVQQTLKAGQTEERIDLLAKNLKSGMYLVSVAAGEALHQQRIIIQ